MGKSIRGGKKPLVGFRGRQQKKIAALNFRKRIGDPPFGNAGNRSERRSSTKKSQSALAM